MRTKLSFLITVAIFVVGAINAEQYEGEIRNDRTSIENKDVDTASPRNTKQTNNYSVFAVSNGNGSATASSNSVQEGQYVVLIATPDEGYIFKNWTLNGVVVSTSNPYPAIVTDNCVFIANFEYYPYENGHEYVDLGLSVKWATCNVGATSVEDFGGFYAWGETITKETYSEGLYTFNSKPTTLPLSADAANVNWGGAWRMPTQAEFVELINNCNWESETINGVKGQRVTSQKNGNSIFIPAAGSNVKLAGSTTTSGGGIVIRPGSSTRPIVTPTVPSEKKGLYWSSSLYAGSSGNVYYLKFDSDAVYIEDTDVRYGGYSVRPVCPSDLLSIEESNTEISEIEINYVPSVGEVSITSPEEISQVQVYNLQGVLMKIQMPGVETATICVCDYPKGVYIITVQSKGEIKTKKILIK